MQNAFVCGIVAALSFIGFVCIIYFIMLWFYRPKGNSSYIIKIPSKIDRGEAESLIYGAYLKKMIFGDLIFDDIFIDSEIMSLEPYALLQSWYGSRRFSLIFTKKIFHMIISQRRTNLIGHFHRQTPGTVLKQILLPVFYHLQR